MCTRAERNILKVYEHFLDKGEHNIYDSVNSLKSEGVRLNAFSLGIFEMIYMLRDSRQIEEVSNKRDYFKITKLGKENYNLCHKMAYPNRDITTAL